MRTKAFLIIFLLLISVFSVFGVDEGSMVRVDGGSEGYNGNAVEPLGFFGLFSRLFAFVSPLNCPVVDRYRANYLEGVNNQGQTVTGYGVRCGIGDRIELVACLLPSNAQPNSCQRLFSDDWLKSSENDFLDLQIACDGGNCYNYAWYVNAINNRYVGYNCRHCTDTNDCLDANPLNICKAEGVDMSHTGRVIDPDLNCPSSMLVCWVPGTGPNTPCEIIESLGYDDCFEHSQGVCSGDDRHYCSQGNVYTAMQGVTTYYFCIVNGQPESPSFTVCPNGCSNGICASQNCFPDYEWCEGSDVYRCSSDGMDEEIIDTCGADEVCVEHSFTQASCDLEVERYGITCAGQYCYCILSSTGVYTSLDDCNAEAERRTDLLVNSSVQCSNLYAPVCGADNVTYHNSCYAEIFEVDYYVAGACQGEDSGEDSSDLPFVVILLFSVVGIICVILLVLLVIYFVRKRG